jgi:hypothetical protein
MSFRSVVLLGALLGVTTAARAEATELQIDFTHPEQGRVALKTLRVSVCQAWLDHESLEREVHWVVSVDWGFTEHIRVIPATDGAMTVEDTVRERRPNLQFDDHGQLVDQSRLETTTLRFDRIKILGTEPPRVLGEDPFDCSTLDGHEPARIRLVKTATGATREC